jgi:hypothetical protein
MLLVYILISIFIGIVLAVIINRLFANKISSKIPRIIMKLIANIVCIIFVLTVVLLSSIKPALSKFIDGRIDTIEVAVNKSYPDKKIMEMSVNASEFSETLNQFQQAIKGINTSRDGYFEKMVFDAFMSKLTPYLNTADSLSKDFGDATLKSVLFKIKDMSLATVSHYVTFFIMIIVVIFLVIMGIYAVIASVMIKKWKTS